MKNFSLDSFFLAIATTITAAFLVLLLFLSNSKSKAYSNALFFFLAYTNPSLIIIIEWPYHLTASKDSLFLHNLILSFVVPWIYPVILCKRIVLSFSLLLFCFSHHYHINPRIHCTQILIQRVEEFHIFRFKMKVKHLTVLLNPSLMYWFWNHD